MPKFTLTSKKEPEPSEHTKRLLAARGATKPGGVIEWDIASNVSLTATEIEALRRKHGTNTPNLQRAAEVKELIVQGKTGVQIAATLRLRHRGKTGYGARMVQADHATLLSVGEGHKSNTKHRNAAVKH